jgi:hypothetical protein
MASILGITAIALVVESFGQAWPDLTAHLTAL